MVVTEAFPVSIPDVVEKWKDKEGNLIMVLHQIQNALGYVPRELAKEMSHALDVPLARIYEVLTFYHYFKMTPPGNHTVAVCMGTACYLKGGPVLMEEIKNAIKIKEGETTEDGAFHLEAVRCIGCCGLAPTVVVDDKVHSALKKGEIVKIFDQLRKKTEENVS